MTDQYNKGLPVKFEGFRGADCRDVFTFFDDFLSSSISATDDAAIWDLTKDDSGTAVITNGTDTSQEFSGGLVSITADATSGDVANLLANGEAFQIDQGYPLYFEARWFNTDVSDVHTFVGLANASETSAVAALSSPGIGFEGISTTLNILTTNAGGANVDAISSITLLDTDTATAWYRAAFYYDGDNTVTFYWATGDNDLAQIHVLKLDTTTDYVPQDLMMTPCLEAYRKAGSADIFYVDYVLVQQARCRAPE